MAKRQMTPSEFMFEAWSRGFEYDGLIYHAEHTFDVELPTEAE